MKITQQQSTEQVKTEHIRIYVGRNNQALSLSQQCPETYQEKPGNFSHINQKNNEGIMSNLVLTNSAGKDITTSLIVAEVFGKEHNKVSRDIEKLSCSEQFRAANFGVSSYITSQGKELPMYEITKDGFSFLVMGYTGEKAGEFKEKFIAEFNKRESLLKNDDYIIGRAMSLIFDRTKALEQQIQQKEERLQFQEHVIKQNAPKIEYFEEVLQSGSTYTTTQIAKEMGMGAPTLNRKLHILGVQYKVSGTWVLYEKYQEKGYTDTNTHPYNDNGIPKTAMLTVWTEKGREFIHSLNINRNG